MSHEAGLLGMPAKATLAVLGMRRKCAELLAHPKVADLFEAGTQSLAVVTKDVALKPSLLGRLLSPDSDYLPPLVNLAPASTRAHTEWQAASPRCGYPKDFSEKCAFSRRQATRRSRSVNAHYFCAHLAFPAPLPDASPTRAPLSLSFVLRMARHSRQRHRWAGVPKSPARSAVYLRSVSAAGAVRMRSRIPRTAANTGEYSPARPSVFGNVRPCSLAFAVP